MATWWRRIAPPVDCYGSVFRIEMRDTSKADRILRWCPARFNRRLSATAQLCSPHDVSRPCSMEQEVSQICVNRPWCAGEVARIRPLGTLAICWPEHCTVSPSEWLVFQPKTPSGALSSTLTLAQGPKEHHDGPEDCLLEDRQGRS